MEDMCPDSYYCEDGSHGYSAINSKLLVIQTVAGLVSSVLSIVGAIIILLAYCAFKDLKKGSAQIIITLLSLADLGTAFGCLVGVVNYYIFQGTSSDYSSACCIFNNFCQIQASVTMWCGLSSSIWSTVLAVNFLLTSLLIETRWTERLLYTTLQHCGMDVSHYYCSSSSDHWPTWLYAYISMPLLYQSIIQC